MINDLGRRCGQYPNGRLRMIGPGYHRKVNLDATWLFLSLIPSGIGFVLFVYGKKQQRWPQLVAGIAFSVYPYFTGSVGAMVGVGFLLGGLLWGAIRMGW